MKDVQEKLSKDQGKLFHPGFSIDCVIFGFHENELKVLLLQMKGVQHWSLPGGFVLKDENVDEAAGRILESRTGLNKVFLQQFYLFGNTDRNNIEINKKYLTIHNIAFDDEHWLLQRFITMGYYALVEFSKANPRPDILSTSCEWWDINKLPDLGLDHRDIVEKALDNVRRQLSYLPIGYNLLPKKFTMPELQKLYETILGKKLDRRNFQRKILSYKILNRLEERKTGGAHKAPYLYSFNLDRYNKALAEGLSGSW